MLKKTAIISLIAVISLSANAKTSSVQIERAYDKCIDTAKTPADVMVCSDTAAEKYKKLMTPAKRKAFVAKEKACMPKDEMLATTAEMAEAWECVHQSAKKFTK